MLVVDDSNVSRLMLVEQIEDMGHLVHQAEDGEEALEKIRTQRIDIVFCDVEMPRLRGPELLNHLRREGFLQKLLVVMVSAQSQSNIVAACIEAGAEDYLIKPIQPVLLQARMNACVERKIRRDHEEFYLKHTETLNRRLRESNQKLKELDLEKNEFLGIAAHDLKNPITSILGTVTLIEDDPASFTHDEIKRFMQMVEKSCHRMHDIIVNLLDINRIEAGAVTMSLEATDLGTAAREALQHYETAAEEKQIRISSSFPPGCIVMADVRALGQVLDNLISNAIKYSPRDRQVTVTVHDDGHAGRVIIQDQGPGLSEEDQKKLFGKFVRLSSKPTAGEHSTGLGLSIVKRLVEMMEGKVWCESQLGHGCRFVVELPRVIAS